MDQRHVEISGDGTNSLQDLIIWNFISIVYTPDGIYITIVGHNFINRISWHEVLPNFLTYYCTQNTQWQVYNSWREFPNIKLCLIPSIRQHLGYNWCDHNFISRIYKFYINILRNWDHRMAFKIGWIWLWSHK